MGPPVPYGMAGRMLTASDDVVYLPAEYKRFVIKALLWVLVRGHTVSFRDRSKRHVPHGDPVKCGPQKNPESGADQWSLPPLPQRFRLAPCRIEPSARSPSVVGRVLTIRTASDRRPRPCCAGRAAYWRAMCMRSSASESSVSFPLTSTVTLWMVPVNLNGLA